MNKLYFIEKLIVNACQVNKMEKLLDCVLFKEIIGYQPEIEFSKIGKICFFTRCPFPQQVFRHH
jgi:hypothetical protein